jgi:uncharacterized membrane protein YjjP (DUF1212 family)
LELQTVRLKRLSRICAWGLLAGAILLVVSGWGITQTGIIYKATFGLVDRRLADEIHRAVNGPLAVLFLGHVLINIKLYFTRKNSGKAWLTDLILIVVGTILLAGVAYMQYIRKGG